MWFAQLGETGVYRSAVRQSVLTQRHELLCDLLPQRGVRSRLDRLLAQLSRHLSQDINHDAVKPSADAAGRVKLLPFLEGSADRLLDRFPSRLESDRHGPVVPVPG